MFASNVVDTSIYCDLLRFLTHEEITPIYQFILHLVFLCILFCTYYYYLDNKNFSVKTNCRSFWHKSFSHLKIIHSYVCPVVDICWATPDFPIFYLKSKLYHMFLESGTNRSCGRNCFQIECKFYKQEYGTPIGNSLSLSLISYP